jgi:hypothetical protein
MCVIPNPYFKCHSERSRGIPTHWAARSDFSIPPPSPTMNFPSSLSRDKAFTMKQTLTILLVVVLFSIAASGRGRSSSRSTAHSYSSHSHSSRSTHTRSASTHSYRAPTYTPHHSVTTHRNTYHSTPTHTYSSHRTTSTSTSRHGRIHRSAQAREAFQHSHPCPATGKRSGACPGYVIDHIRPLSKGGPDAPSNMQWQTTSAAKAKDKWERK